MTGIRRKNVNDAKKSTVNELKPCPFCGNIDIELNSKILMHSDCERFWIECPDCQISTRYFETNEDALRMWNKRAEDNE